MKCQKVEETFGPQLEYEPIEVEHILAEPETDKFSVDDILCFGKEDTRKSSVLEEIFHGFDYGFTGKCADLVRLKKWLGFGSKTTWLSSMQAAWLGIWLPRSGISAVHGGQKNEADRVCDLARRHSRRCVCEAKQIAAKKASPAWLCAWRKKKAMRLGICVSVRHRWPERGSVQCGRLVSCGQQLNARRKKELVRTALRAVEEGTNRFRTSSDLSSPPLI
ncbi:uncharacterized protein LOC110811246 isoform X1 [Carica papaya]|uniref:uncharacterized protein LOC110811246 isoform X1 n=1 Tax=Carica papaya TaxID=3649 RepID=UPI000B8D0D32|nr:uncharacterized protein LOC110811246 isoform X1 [Carica papaya]